MIHMLTRFKHSTFHCSQGGTVHCFHKLSGMKQLYGVPIQLSQFYIEQVLWIIDFIHADKI